MTGKSSLVILGNVSTGSTLMILDEESFAGNLTHPDASMQYCLLVSFTKHQLIGSVGFFFAVSSNTC
jgi:hypothetical protein